MKAPSIPQSRKHFYFYALLILGAVALGNIKFSGDKPAKANRVTEVNKLANSLFP